MRYKFNKWDRCLKVINSEITNLSINRYIFKEVQNIIKNNQRIQKPSAFYDFLGNSYVASALMGIRRQVKIDKDSISFARLLNEIFNNPEVLSRKRFVELYRGRAVEGYANSDFDKLAGEGASHIRADLVKLDFDKLGKKAEQCEKYADRRIAHFDKRGLKNVLTFEELDNCIDFLEELLKKYLLLFYASDLVSVLPVFQYDWRAIFRERWLS